MDLQELFEAKQQEIAQLEKEIDQARRELDEIVNRIRANNPK